MADVQLEHGYTKMANEIFENVAKIKLSPTQYRILFIVWRYTYGFNRKEHNMSLKFLSQAIDCDHRQIQRELKSLEERKVISQVIKSGSYRKISFNKNYDEWIGKTKNVGKTDIGEITIGEIDNGETSNTGVGEIDNGTIGETVKATIGEIDNQEIKKENSKENFKENHHDRMDKPNPFNEFEKYFGSFPSAKLIQQINDWIDDSQFKDPESIICETIRRIKSEAPRTPSTYLQTALVNLHNLGLFTLAAVLEYNEKFDQKTKKKKSVQTFSTERPKHWEEPKPLTKDEYCRMKEAEAELPY
jgi:phage replication O-like protein O